MRPPFLLAGYGRGALVTSFEGRPIKVEGNPLHPASLGATDVFAQAEILALYDPDRSQAIRAAGEISDWPAFELALRARLAGEAAGKGSGLRLLSGRITSPTLLDQIEALLKAYPNMRWHVFEPTEDSDDDAAEAVYGKPLRLRPRFSEADVVVAFEADPLGYGPDQVRFGRELVDRRKRDRASFRFYAVECGMTLTGAFADHRLAARPDAIEAMVAALAAALGAPIARPELPREHARFIDAAAKDLRAPPAKASCWSGLHWRTHGRSACGSTTGSMRRSTPSTSILGRRERGRSPSSPTIFSTERSRRSLFWTRTPWPPLRAISNSKRGSIERPSGSISDSTMTRPRRLRPGICRRPIRSKAGPTSPAPTERSASFSR